GAVGQELPHLRRRGQDAGRVEVGPADELRIGTELRRWQVEPGQLLQHQKVYEVVLPRLRVGGGGHLPRERGGDPGAGDEVGVPDADGGLAVASDGDLAVGVDAGDEVLAGGELGPAGDVERGAVAIPGADGQLERVLRAQESRARGHLQSRD